MPYCTVNPSQSALTQKQDIKLSRKSAVIQILTHIKHCEKTRRSTSFPVARMREEAMGHLMLQWILKDVRVLDRRGGKNLMAEEST